jgi:hypothetical protein
MAVQDDRREKELRELFKLTKPEDSGRSGVDAVLEFNGVTLPFELKSTSKKSVTTVRDFGLDHIAKWKGEHWLVGFYDSEGESLQYTVYATPEQMLPWIDKKGIYIRPDYLLSKSAPDLLTMKDLFAVFGEKQSYTLDDAKSLQKKQVKAREYEKLMDLPKGYSQERMLQFLKSRCQYLIKRGSTLNNPHIPAKYFRDFERITDNHAARLRELVAMWCKSYSKTLATAEAKL